MIHIELFANLIVQGKTENPDSLSTKASKRDQKNVTSLRIVTLRGKDVRGNPLQV